MSELFIQPKPYFLKSHSFTKTWIINKSVKQCWDVLNSMETFTKGQMFPYRVEFVSENTTPSFSPGVWTNHHGPLLNVCGKIGEMKHHEYRDLNYSYGSYVLSFRFIRPVRLQFFFKSHENGTELRVQLDTYVVPWLMSFWGWAQSFFWSGFGLTIQKKM